MAAPRVIAAGILNMLFDFEVNSFAYEERRGCVVAMAADGACAIVKIEETNFSLRFLVTGSAPPFPSFVFRTFGSRDFEAARALTRAYRRPPYAHPPRQVAPHRILS